MPARVTVAVHEALRSLLLLLHHQLDHIVLVHELLALADSIFALNGTTVFRFNIFALAVDVGGQLRAHGPLKLLHVSVVRFDSGLARESVRCRFVRVLWLVLLG